MEKSGFFNSLGNDRIYDASDIASFLSKFFTNGIFNNSLKVGSNNNMTVTVEKGSANINGYVYELTDKLNLDIKAADELLDRIDSVILRLDLSERNIKLMILEGGLSSEPVSPVITRNNNVYDLRLANITIAAKTVEITNSMINDTRLDGECGNVTQAVLSLDTSNLFKQYQEWFVTWFENIKNQLSTDVAGNLQNQINNIFSLIGTGVNEYEVDHKYSAGDLTIYNNIIYECIEDTNGKWDVSKWSILQLITDTKNINDKLLLNVHKKIREASGKIGWKNKNQLDKAIENFEITLETSDYDYYEIIYRGSMSSDSSERLSTGKIPRGCGTRLFMTYASGDTCRIRERVVSFISDTTLKIGPNLGVDGNSTCIPILVLLYKE